ncbi:MAG: MFS transporter [Planctomycetota bacterium]|nr:MAG: MFS transporter [Planctomycetota bacterium]
MVDADPLKRADSVELPARLSVGMRARLSVMMLLQYAVWGAWWVVLAKYMSAIKFTGADIGRVYATTAVASIISPIVFGQIADRWVPTQYLLALLHLLAAGSLYLSTRFTEFMPFFICVLAWALLYIPTISLSNSLSFHQVPDAAKHFPGIRVFGTIGWIVAGLMVGVLHLNEASIQPILFAVILSVILGLYCFTLPHTPPTGKPGDRLPPLRALGMLKDGNFAVFIVVSFIIAIILAGYFAFTAVFLAVEPLNLNNAAPLMTVGQFTEMLLLPILPFFLKYLGMKRTIALGMAAWGIRYAIFAVGQPAWFVILGIALHGICYDFFFVAAYIHTDNQASKDIRASAQALFNLVVMGLGMLIGNELFGRLVDVYTEGDKVNWPVVWFYPAVGAAFALALFLALFREKKESSTEEAL